VKPDTVIRWHKTAFKCYWRRKSQAGKRGRPSLDPEVRALILKMGDANPLWGAPKIHGELLKLGVVVSERTARPPRPGSIEVVPSAPADHTPSHCAVQYGFRERLAGRHRGGQPTALAEKQIARRRGIAPSIFAVKIRAYPKTCFRSIKAQLK
jgi:hypothetical protein